MNRQSSVGARLQELGFDPELWSTVDEKGSDSDQRAKPAVVRLARRDLKPNLFDYQRDLASQVLRLVGSGERLLLSLPTGAGKTRTGMAALIELFREQPNARCVWLAPSLELVDQAARTFEALWRDYPDAADCNLAVRTASPEGSNLWLQTPQFLANQQSRHEAFTVAVFDEAHQLGAPTFRSAWETAAAGSSLQLGLSATPGRNSGDETADLVDFFGGRLLVSKILGKDPVKTLQDRGVLAKLNFRRITKHGVPEHSVQRARVLLELCRRLIGRERRALVFTETVVDAKAIATVLASEGLAASYVEGELPETVRSERLRSFGEGKLSLLLNQKLLATGYDCPAVSDVVLAGRIGSPILFEQVVGRAARGPLTGGNRYARVWQFDDHLKIHGLPQSYYRFRDYLWA